MSNPGAGIFVFRLRNGLGEFPAGVTVRVSGNNVNTLAELENRSLFAQALDYVGDLLVKTAHAANLSNSYKTGAGGMFTVRATGFSNTSTLTVQAGETNQTFTAAQLGVSGGCGPGLTLTVTGGSAFVSGASSTATIAATAKDASGNTVTINPGDVTWTVESSSITAAWWGNRDAGNTNGLAGEPRLFH